MRKRLPAPKGYIFTQFWIFYIFVTTVGLFYNHLFLLGISGTISQTSFDVAAFLIVTIIIYLLENKARNDPKEFEALVWKVYVAQFLAFAVLHVLSYGAGSIAGIPLRHYTSFTPFVNNVHQTAMLLCVLPFLGLFFLQTQPRFLVKVFLLVSILWYSVMAMETGSTKASLGLVVGGAVAVMHIIFYSFKHRGQKILTTITLAAALATFFVLNLDELMLQAGVFFLEADPHEARAFLYTAGLEHATHSLLIGYGPGPQILYGDGTYWDVHQTFLAVLLQGGLVAIIAFFLFLSSVMRRVFQNPFLLAGFASLMIYAMGGDILRRVPMWIFLLTVFYLTPTMRRREPPPETPIAQKGGLLREIKH